MLVYIYDKDTKEYMYKYSPQKNPKNPNEYLFPINSTKLKPEIIKNYVPVYDGEKWIQIRDYRGQKFINTITKEIGIINYLGELSDDIMLYSDYQKTNEYIIEQNEKEKFARQQLLLNQISEVDLKRIRAFCEPSLREDGSSWLDYYTNQIKDLRLQLQEIS